MNHVLSTQKHMIRFDFGFLSIDLIKDFNFCFWNTFGFINNVYSL